MSLVFAPLFDCCNHCVVVLNRSILLFARRKKFNIYKESWHLLIHSTSFVSLCERAIVEESRKMEDKKVCVRFLTFAVPAK